MEMTINIPGLPELAEALHTLAREPLAPAQAFRMHTEPETATKQVKDDDKAPDHTEKASATPQLAEVRAAMLAKQKEVGTPRVKALLQSFDVPRLSELPAEKYVDFMRGLGELHA